MAQPYCTDITLTPIESQDLAEHPPSCTAIRYMLHASTFAACVLQLCGSPAAARREGVQGDGYARVHACTHEHMACDPGWFSCVCGVWRCVCRWVGVTSSKLAAKQVSKLMPHPHPHPLSERLCGPERLDHAIVLVAAKHGYGLGQGVWHREHRGAAASDGMRYELWQVRIRPDAQYQPPYARR